MPAIMILCRTTGKPVRTGLVTEVISFDSLADITIPLHCPACGKLHRWQRKNAWVDKEGARNPSSGQQ
jgi:hypothetical protein